MVVGQREFATCAFRASGRRVDALVDVSTRDVDQVSRIAHTGLS